MEQRKVTEIENHNFVKLITLFLQNMLAQKEINVKIRYFQKIKSNEFIFPAVTETDMSISSSQLEIYTTTIVIENASLTVLHYKHK